MDWKDFATPEELDQARLALSNLKEAVSQVGFQVTVLESFAMIWSKRMVEASINKPPPVVPQLPGPKDFNESIEETKKRLNLYPGEDE